ncbi:MAG: aldehyde dehydrogenase family protein [Bacteroidota bacterium]
MYQSINPVDDQLLGRFPSWNTAQLRRHLDRARDAYHLKWRPKSVAERILALREVSRRLRTERERLARLITLEMGKPIAQSRSEVDKCVALCEYYFEIAPQVLALRTLDGAKILPQPLGGVLGVMPWNYPIWQVFRFAIPALLAGNVVLLKPADNVPQCSAAIEALFEQALAPLCFSILWIEEPQVAQAIEHPLVQGIALTGSDRAGAIVAGQAARAIKKCVLELGGNDAYLVLRDADVVQAARQAVRSRLKNAGQSCISAKRLIVEAPVLEAFKHAFIEALEQVRMGDPFDERTELGALASAEVLLRLEAQVADARAKGAEVLVDGGRTCAHGNFFSPMLLTNIRPSMRAYREELFGPVALLFVVADEKAAIRLANDTPYGLGATVWSSDPERAERVAAQLEVGAVAINKMLSSEPRLPFGGVKRSGYGVELGPEGLLEFVNQKTLTFGG